jgi:hypothetical protein
MHQRGGLQRLPCGFASHFVRGKLAQFFINKRKNFLCCDAIALRRCLE